MMGVVAARYGFGEAEMWALPLSRLRYWYNLALAILKGGG